MIDSRAMVNTEKKNADCQWHGADEHNDCDILRCRHARPTHSHRSVTNTDIHRPTVLCHLCAKNFHRWWKFDKVLTNKNKFAVFLRHGAFASVFFLSFLLNESPQKRPNAVWRQIRQNVAYVGLTGKDVSVSFRHIRPEVFVG